MFVDRDLFLVKPTGKRCSPRTSGSARCVWPSGFQRAARTSWGRWPRGWGWSVNAGHDLDLDNLAAFIAIGGIAEVSIGHALIADALDIGLAAAVRKYLDAIAAGTAERGV